MDVVVIEAVDTRTSKAGNPYTVARVTLSGLSFRFYVRDGKLSSQDCDDPRLGLIPPVVGAWKLPALPTAERA